MGSGSSRKKTVSRHIQVPSASKSRTRSPSPEISIRHSKRPFSSQPSPWLQKQESNTNLAQYASIWGQNGKLSSTFEGLLRSESSKIEHHQKETRSENVTTKHRSTYQSAEVESVLVSQIESIHDLKTSEKIDLLINHLKQTHVDFDEAVKHRIGQITTETESILGQIVQETQQSQQELLIHAKEQQTIEDEEYRHLLEEFIAKLDEKRAKQLSFIQEQLQEQRLQIFNESQLKIRSLSEQANSVKSQIMSEEERKASERIDSLVDEINSISTDSTVQHLGAEIKTNINLTLYEKVHSNTSEKTNHQNFDRNHSTKHQIMKRTTFIGNETTNEQTNRRPSSSRLSDHQITTINKSAKQNPLNAKTKLKQTQ